MSGWNQVTALAPGACASAVRAIAGCLAARAIAVGLSCAARTVPASAAQAVRVAEPACRTAPSARGTAASGRLRLPLPGAGIAYHYLLMTSATLPGLAKALRGDVPVVWEKAEGTR